MSENKLKILCLHGFRQNKDTFRRKLGFLRKMLISHSKFEFIDAPHLLICDRDGETFDSDERSWWFTGQNQSYISNVPSDQNDGFEHSLRSVQSFVKENGPFDGLLGFSQGAAFAGIIAALIEKKEFDASFRFVVLVAGFKSLCKQHRDIYNGRVNLPSLHIIGDTDNVISAERSEELMAIFHEPHSIRHSGGHYVPGGKELKEQYIKFLKLFI